MRNKSSRVSNPNDFITCSGEKFHILYSSRLNPDGTFTLHVSSRENIRDKINSFAAATDMTVIINRLKNGDTSVLTHKKPLFADFTEFPKTYAEAFDLVQRSEKTFEQLPIDVKQKFDNDVSVWFATIGSPSWTDKMGFNSVPDSSVKEGEE